MNDANRAHERKSGGIVTERNEVNGVKARKFESTDRSSDRGRSALEGVVA